MNRGNFKRTGAVFAVNFLSTSIAWIEPDSALWVSEQLDIESVAVDPVNPWTVASGERMFLSLTQFDFSHPGFRGKPHE